MKNSTVAHNWAHQLKSSQNGSHFFFKGDTIYSYGHHFPIARRISSDIFLFTSRGYSSTTSQHKAIVSRAIPGKCIVVNDVCSNGPDNLLDIAKRAVAAIESSSRRRLQHGKDWNIQQANELVWSYELYKKELKVRGDKQSERLIKLAKEVLANVKEELPKIKKRIEDERRVEQARVKRELKQNIDDWHAGKVNRVSGRLEFALVRRIVSIRDGESCEFIETSQGSYAPLKAAKVLYNLLQHGKPVHGIEVGDFSVKGYVNGILSIGCHQFERSELNRLGVLLGWGELENAEAGLVRFADYEKNNQPEVNDGQH